MLLLIQPSSKQREMLRRPVTSSLNLKQRLHLSLELEVLTSFLPSKRRSCSSFVFVNSTTVSLLNLTVLPGTWSATLNHLSLTDIPPVTLLRTLSTVVVSQRLTAQGSQLTTTPLLMQLLESSVSHVWRTLSTRSGLSDLTSRRLTTSSGHTNSLPLLEALRRRDTHTRRVVHGETVKRTLMSSLPV